MRKGTKINTRVVIVPLSHRRDRVLETSYSALVYESISRPLGRQVQRDVTRGWLKKATYGSSRGDIDLI